MRSSAPSPGELGPGRAVTSDRDAASPTSKRWAIVAAALVAAGLILAGVARYRASAAPAAYVASGAPGRFVDSIEARAFQRGNIHTHTSLTDGDSPPADVYAWYRDHGYAFVAVTDHNTLTDPAGYRELARPGFALISGEEITMTSLGKPVHVNALCTKRTIGGGDFPDAVAALTRAIAEVKAQGGVALVNHPNFEWALTVDDVAASRGAHLLEIWSGHPHVRIEGDVLRPSNEAIWDAVLTRGETFAGVAVDDMHHLASAAPDPAARPGRGWVEVFATEASEEAICDGLRRGRLYASNGASLTRIAVGEGALSVSTDATLVEFIGQGGVLLETARPAAGAGEVTYRLRGGERYVRARVTDAQGKRAWTQAYRVAP